MELRAGPTTAVADEGGSVGGSPTTIAAEVSTTIATTGSIDTAAHESFDGSNPRAPWGKIIVIELLAVVLGSVGGVRLTRVGKQTHGSRSTEPHHSSGRAGPERANRR